MCHSREVKSLIELQQCTSCLPPNVCSYFNPKCYKLNKYARLGLYDSSGPLWCDLGP